LPFLEIVHWGELIKSASSSPCTEEYFQQMVSLQRESENVGELGEGGLQARSKMR